MDWDLEKDKLEKLILTDKVSYEEIGRMSTTLMEMLPITQRTIYSYYVLIVIV